MEQSLDEIRAEIDRIDPQIRDLVLQRMCCSHKVAKAKRAAGNSQVYRANREAAILDRLGTDVPAELRSGYLSIVRKVMAASRAYQYGLLLGWDPTLFENVAGSQIVDAPTRSVTVRLDTQGNANALAFALSTITDQGFDVERVKQVEELPDGADEASGASTFDLTIPGDGSALPLRAVLFQLASEYACFSIVAADVA